MCANKLAEIEDFYVNMGVSILPPEKQRNALKCAVFWPNWNNDRSKPGLWDIYLASYYLD